MGARLAYYYFEQPTGKSLKEIIIDNFVPFPAWYLNMCKESLLEFDEEYGPAHLKQCLENAKYLQTDFNQLDQQFIDQFTKELLGGDNYLKENGMDLKLFGPLMGTGRYISSTELVKRTGNVDFLTLWNYLIEGRSLKNDAPFLRDDYDIKVGFLKVQEHRKLKNYIESYFGTYETIREKYWTNLEKKQDASARAEANGGLYWLFGNKHDPISTGLECMLQALNEINEKDVEIVTFID